MNILTKLHGCQRQYGVQVSQALSNWGEIDMVVLGVDLRASAKRASTVVALDQKSVLSFMGSFSEDDELVQIALTHKPIVTMTRFGLMGEFSASGVKFSYKPNSDE